MAHIGLEIILHVDRRIHSEVPKILRRVVKPVQITRMSEKWWPCDAGWHGEHHVEVVGQPVVIDSTFDLLPIAGGCRYSIQQNPRVAIPLVGRQAERALERQLAKGWVELCDQVEAALR